MWEHFALRSGQRLLQSLVEEEVVEAAQEPCIGVPVNVADPFCLWGLDD